MTFFPAFRDGPETSTFNNPLSTEIRNFSPLNTTSIMAHRSSPPSSTRVSQCSFPLLSHLLWSNIFASIASSSLSTNSFSVISFPSSIQRHFHHIATDFDPEFLKQPD